jgi:DNA-binding response OmpR family regulator
LPLIWKAPSYLEAIEHLRDQCLIDKRNGKYDYFSPLFEAFVRRQRVRDVLQAGPVLVDLRRKRVLSQGKPLRLSPTNYALLACLMQRAGQVVSYEELWQAACPDEPYEAGRRLRSSIRSLRRTLGDDADCIVNVRGVGYLFEQPDWWLC